MGPRPGGVRPADRPFQGVSFPLAEYATYVKGARHVCYEALWLKDSDLEHSSEAAMGKFWAPKLATDVIHQCLLTLGHLGYSTESPVGQRLRDVIGLEIGDGTAQVSSSSSRAACSAGRSRPEQAREEGRSHGKAGQQGRRRHRRRPGHRQGHRREAGR